MDDKTYIPYRGTALPGIGEVIVLFSSTVAYGPRAAPHYRCFWVDVAFLASQLGGVELEVSPDGGVTWTDVGTSEPVTVGDTVVSFFVSPYQDWRVVFTNGAAAQTSFHVDFVIDHNSRGSLAQA